MKFIIKFLTLFLITIFLSASYAAGKKVKIAVFDLVPSGKIQTDLSSLSEIMIAEIDMLGKYEVISKSEIKAMIGFEQEKQLLGCQDDTSCLAEIGGALGVDRLITGTVGKIGKNIIVSIKYINTKTVKVEARVYENFKGDETLLVDTIKRLIPRLFGIVKKEKGLGTLIIETNLKGARIYLDGNPIGKTPIEPMKLKEGQYNLQISSEGYKSWSKAVTIKNKKATEIIHNFKGTQTAEKSDYSADADYLKGIAKKDKQSKNDSKKMWYKKWWVWSVAASVVAGTTAAAFALNSKDNSSSINSGNSSSNNSGKNNKPVEGRILTYTLPIPTE